MNKYLLKFIILCSCIFFASWAKAQNDTVYLSFKKTEIKCGEQKAIVLQVRNFTDIVTMNFSVRYNQSLITFKNFTGANPTAQTIVNGLSQGDVSGGQTFSWSGTPTSVPDGDFFLLNFEPKAESGGLNGIIDITGMPVAIKIESQNGAVKKTHPVKITSARFDIIDTHPPKITCPTSRYIQIPATDNSASVNGLNANFKDSLCGKAIVSYNLSGATNGAGVDEDATGKLFNLGTTNVKYTARDNAGNTAACNFQVVLAQATTKPTFYNTAPDFRCEDTTLTIDVRVANFKDITAVDYQYRFDKNAFDLKSIQNLNPTINATNSGFVSGAFAANGLIIVSFSDPTGLTLPDNTLLYSITLRKKAGAAEAAPEFLSVEVTTKTSPTTAVPVQIIRNLIPVIDDIFPTIDCPKDTAIYTTPTSPNSVQLFGIEAKAKDNCQLQQLTYSFSGATVIPTTPSANGKFFNAGATMVNATVKDFAGNTKSCSFNVFVRRLGVKMQSDTVDCRADTVQLALTVRDFIDMKRLDVNLSWNKDSLQYQKITFIAPWVAGTTALSNLGSSTDNLAISLVSSNPNGVSMSDNQVIAKVTYKILNGNLGKKSRIDVAAPTAIKADNTMILAAATNGFLSILDTEGPKIIGCPTDTIIRTNQCFFDYTWIAPTAVDFCSAFELDDTNAPSTPTARISAPTTFFYTFKDDYNNASTCRFKVTVRDTIKPVINNCDTSTITLPTDPILGTCEAKFPANFANINVTENCLYSINANIAPGQALGLGAHTYTLTVRDSTGNTATCSRKIIVRDGNGPTFDPNWYPVATKLLRTAPGRCDTTFTWIVPTATDDCGGPVTITSDKVNGSTFPKGTTIVTFTARDARGNTTLRNLNLVVLDFELPKFKDCPNGKRDTTLYAGSDCDVAFIPPTIEYTDNCETSTQIAMTADAPANNIYAVGKKTLLYIANSPAAVCEYTITVKDTVAPKIICPSIGAQNATAGNCYRLINSLPAPIVLSDNCTTAPTYTISPQQVRYPVGTTIVKYTVIDDAGNTANCTFEVLVRDNTAPVLDCQTTDITVNTEANKATAKTTWAAITASDNCGVGKVKIDSTHTRNNDFKLGNTIVTYTAKDSTGNTSTCSFNVLVIDNQQPIFAACPTSAIDQSAGANCEFGFSLLKNLAVSDNHNITFRDSTGTRPNGKYPVGNYPLTYIVRDSSGNSTTCAFTLRIADRVGPKRVTCPTDAQNSFNAAAGNCDVTLTNISQLAFPTFVDNCDVSPKFDTLRWENNTWVKGLPSGLTFKAGETRLAIASRDAANNIGDTCFFRVSVVGNVKPSLPVGCGVGNLVVNATGCTTPVTYGTPVATYSPCSTKQSEGYNIASGSPFSIGIRTVTYTATDKNNNTAACSFTVTVKDVTAPKITFEKDTVVVNTTNCSEKVSWNGPAIMEIPCDTVRISSAVFGALKPGDTFPVGITAVTYFASDRYNNITQRNLYIWVKETTPPIFTQCPRAVEINVDGTVVADPDGFLAQVPITNSSCDSATIAYGLNKFAAIDNCDGANVTIQYPTNRLPVLPFKAAIGESAVRVTAKDKSGNISVVCEVKIKVNPFVAKPNPTVDDALPCIGDAVRLKTNTIANTEATWIKGAFVAKGFDVPLINVTASNSGFYKVRYQKGNCKSTTDSVRVDVIVPPTIKGDTIFVKSGETKSGNITANDLLIKDAKYKVTFKQSPNPDFGSFTSNDKGEVSFAAKATTPSNDIAAIYDICYDDCPDACLKDQKLWIRITKEVPSVCKVPNFLSPNNDGFNDKLEIDCIGTATGARIYIYSQWGEEVYSSMDYKNDWDGTWKSKPLPDGTYFFVFMLTPNAEAKKGYITIFR